MNDDAPRNRLNGAAWRLKQIMQLHEDGKIEWSVVQKALSEISQAGEDYTDQIVEMTDDDLMEYLKSLQPDA